jgi:hypothetical protein
MRADEYKALYANSVENLEQLTNQVLKRTGFIKDEVEVSANKRQEAIGGYISPSARARELSAESLKIRKNKEKESTN